MRKRIYSIMAAALLMTGALLTTACSTDEEAAIDNAMPGADSGETIQFTATLAPKDGDAQTRAITTGTDANGSETLNVAWAQGEYIAIYYQKTDDSWAKVRATVGTPNGDGSAPITATLTGAKGGTANFIYPYSLAKDGELDTSLDSKFRTQNGTIEYISEFLDAATTTGTIDVTGQTATVSGTISLANQVCICKFSFSRLSADVEEKYYDIIIYEKDGTKTKNTYVAPNIAKASMGAVYMALLGAENKSFKFSVQGKSATAVSEQPNYYETAMTSVTLEAGKFYRSIPVELGTGKLGFTIPAGGTYTLDDATISITNGPAISCEGDATIILKGTNSVTTSAHGQPAIFIPEGKTLTIQGTGSLEASGGNGGAGIGGGLYVNCGSIIIESGTVTATGGGDAAGIGSGRYGSCGSITINGGTVTAISKGDGAGIGSGASDGSSGSCGNITISGGTVTAYSSFERAGDAAGIGSGYNASCGNITISGGSVTATGGDKAAGIGSGGGHGNGRYATCGAITIGGGTVTATGGKAAAGIGSGNYGTCSDITIGSGLTILTATMGYEANAPIGKGKEGSCGDVEIDGKTKWTAGTATTNYTWDVSTVKDSDDHDVTRWTLTKTQ